MNGRQLDERHQRAQKRLHDAVAAALRAALVALPDFGDESFERYGSTAVVVVAGGQHRAARLAAGYLLARAAVRTADLRLDRALAPLLVNRESAVTRSPILRGRKLVAEGASQLEAAQSASGYASGLASTDLGVSTRAGLDEAQRAAQAPIRGYRKVLSVEACPWCVQTAGSTYSRADRVPFHENDHCSVGVVLEGET